MPIALRTIQTASYATVNELKQIPFSFAKALLSESKLGTNLSVLNLRLSLLTVSAAIAAAKPFSCFLQKHIHTHKTLA
jgi:hypothetical protein